MRTLINPFAIILTVSFFLFAGCAKEEGEGGTSSISGKIYVLDYNSSFTYIHDTYYGQDEDVFLIYGDHDYYDDKTSTNYNGTYRFENLRKGLYTIFTYSDDSTFTEPSEQTVQMVEVEITKNNQDIVLDDIIIAK
ncbi:MAG: hypothetical protein KKA07_12090 [Bacteroidetes bacterium]|nr:hypothetical protein [Bacteroidota bacterium]MBU1719798.1 hypothetical protein [Bacteroidota bacterium]